MLKFMVPLFLLNIMFTVRFRNWAVGSVRQTTFLTFRWVIQFDLLGRGTALLASKIRISRVMLRKPVVIIIENGLSVGVILLTFGDMIRIQKLLKVGLFTVRLIIRRRLLFVTGVLPKDQKAKFQLIIFLVL